MGSTGKDEGAILCFGCSTGGSLGAAAGAGEEAAEDDDEVGDGGVASAGCTSSERGGFPDVNALELVLFASEIIGFPCVNALEVALSTSGLGESKLGRAWLSTASKSGGGMERSALDAEALAAKATASGPYGKPNLPNVSLEEMNLTCSAVGPDLGYVNSVRIAVCVRGAEIEWREINDGEVSGLPWLSLVFDIVRDMVLNADRLIPEPLELSARCPRLARPPLGGVPCDSTDVRVTSEDGPDPSRLCPIRFLLDSLAGSEVEWPLGMKKFKNPDILPEDV